MLRIERHAATARSDEPDRSTAVKAKVVHPARCVEEKATDGSAHGDGELDGGDLQASSDLRVVRHVSAEPGAQPTGAAVPNRPHAVRSTAVTTDDVPNAINPSAIAASTVPRIKRKTSI